MKNIAVKYINIRFSVFHCVSVLKMADGDGERRPLILPDCVALHRRIYFRIVTFKRKIIIIVAYGCKVVRIARRNRSGCISLDGPRISPLREESSSIFDERFYQRYSILCNSA